MARIDYQLATDTFEDLKGKTPDDTTSLCDFMSRKGMELTIMQAHKLMEFLLAIESNALTQIEHLALSKYASENGRDWKAKLRDEWMKGTTTSTLQQLRNASHFGPAGLQLYKLPKYIIGELVEEIATGNTLVVQEWDGSTYKVSRVDYAAYIASGACVANRRHPMDFIFKGTQKRLKTRELKHKNAG